jgi:hypothetical protein
MRFFVPDAKEGHDEEAWQNVRSKMAPRLGETTDRRIFKIWYTHNTQTIVAKVGKEHPENHEEVFVIFETSRSDYLVCTINHGASIGGPFFVGKHDIISVEEFESDSQPSQINSLE